MKKYASPVNLVSPNKTIKLRRNARNNNRVDKNKVIEILGKPLPLKPTVIRSLKDSMSPKKPTPIPNTIKIIDDAFIN